MGGVLGMDLQFRMYGPCCNVILCRVGGVVSIFAEDFGSMQDNPDDIRRRHELSHPEVSVEVRCGFLCVFV